MTYLLFLDESGQDHGHLPYEVRGGVAIEASKVWPFIQQMHALELKFFGAALSSFQSEIKGRKRLKAKGERRKAKGERGKELAAKRHKRRKREKDGGRWRW